MSVTACDSRPDMSGCALADAAPTASVPALFGAPGDRGLVAGPVVAQYIAIAPAAHCGPDLDQPHPLTPVILPRRPVS